MPNPLFGLGDRAELGPFLHHEKHHRGRPQVDLQAGWQRRDHQPIVQGLTPTRRVDGQQGGEFEPSGFVEPVGHTPNSIPRPARGSSAGNATVDRRHNPAEYPVRRSLWGPFGRAKMRSMGVRRCG